MPTSDVDLSFPLRLAANGELATVERGTDEHIGQQIAITCMTQRGERPFVPAFGIQEPAFGRLVVSEINACLALFGPPVTVTRVTTKPVAIGTVRHLVEWAR